MLGDRLWALLAPLAVVLLMGCNTLASGPRYPGPSGFDEAALKIDPSTAVLKAQDWSQYKTEAQLTTARNNYVSARMNLIDRAFHEYERTLLQETRTGGFLADFITSALTTGAAVIDDRQIQRAFSTGAATIIDGSQAFDKQVLLDRTLVTLLNEMEAERAEVKTLILERLRLDYDQWPIGFAQTDVDRYYQAGTLVGALKASADSASSRKSEEEDNAETAMTVAFRTDAVTEALRTYLSPADDALMSARLKRAQDVLDVQRNTLNKPKVPVADFIEAGSDSQKKKLLESLRDAETGAARQQLDDVLKALN
jgi:hypothetical protein